MRTRSQLQYQRKRGFTLLEAMIVVAIIGVSAALAAPALSVAMADRRAGDATHSLVRIGARARSEAMALGRAHVLVYSDSSSGSSANGSAQLWRGRTNLCSVNDWAVIVTGTCDGNLNCVESLDMGTYNHGHHQVRMRAVGGSSPVWLCFQPDGELLFAGGATGPFTAVPPAGQLDGLQFSIDRLEAGVAQGVQRRVVFPLGGSPRIVR